MKRALITRQTIIDTVQERSHIILWVTGERTGLLWNPCACEGESGVRVLHDVDLKDVLRETCREHKLPGMIVRGIDGISGLMAYRGGEVTESDERIAGTITACKADDLIDDVIELQKKAAEKSPNSPLARQLRDAVDEMLELRQKIEDEVRKA